MTRGSTRTSLCPLCQQGQLRPVLDVGRVPVHVGVLWPTAARARSSATGDLELAACPTCGLVTNPAFDESLIDYRQKYDNALHASPLFQEFEQAVVERLTERYDLRGGHVVEIGCGSGHFLGLLCTHAGARGVGFDPSHDPEHADPLAAGRVEFVRQPFDDTYVGEPVDLLACRQTLEHIPDATAFLQGLRKALAGHDGAVLYFDVPNSTLPFEDLSIWDLIYEHVHYFVAPSLRYAFEAAGFEILDLYESFNGQFLSVEARIGPERSSPPPPPAGVREFLEHVESFRARFSERQEAWAARLRDFRARGTRVAAWGGGARAVSFFNMLGITGEIPYVVDINPRKQGHFLGGSGQQIVPPEFLTAYEPEVVVVINPVYEQEVAACLRELGVSAGVVTA